MPEVTYNDESTRQKLSIFCNDLANRVNTPLTDISLDYIISRCDEIKLYLEAYQKYIPLHVSPPYWKCNECGLIKKGSFTSGIAHVRFVHKYINIDDAKAMCENIFVANEIEIRDAEYKADSNIELLKWNALSSAERQEEINRIMSLEEKE